MKLPVFVFHDDDQLHLAYKCQSVTSDRQWVETFCFKDGHNEACESYMTDVEPADLNNSEVIVFLAKAQSYHNNLPGDTLDLVPVDSWEDVELPH